MGMLLKILAGIMLSALLVVGGGLAWLVLRKPAQRPAPDIRIERTAERVARGQYVAEAICDCAGCHSDHNYALWGMPVKLGTLFGGGFTFDEKLGVPGTVTAQNLTPDPQTGKASWTDGEILRAIREGVSRDGHALFPMMPYQHYRGLADDDAKAVVAYLRTVPPVHNVIPPSQIAFPVNLFIKFAPQPETGPVVAPSDTHDHHGYGRYLTSIAGCAECHTPHDDHGQPVQGKEFTGGWELKGPWGRVVSANITPHPGTFVGKATKELFVARFKQYENMTMPPPAQKGRATVMPWLAFSHMTVNDLGAIYDYLRTLQPVEHEVNTFPDAAP